MLSPLRNVLCVFAAAASFAALPAIGQDISGTIEGSILDPSGSAVPNAKVTVTNTDRNQVVRETTSNTSGVYSVPLIPVGIYAVKVGAAGFKTQNWPGIVVNVN